MTYIVVSENEIVRAEMERPDRNIYDENGNLFWTWNDYLLSLPRIAAPGHKWKLWDEVVEGKDFEFVVKGYSMGNEMLVPLDFAQGYIQEGEKVDWEAEYGRCRAILQELVYLKSIKGIESEANEYERRKPIAWAAAKKLIGEHHPNTP